MGRAFSGFRPSPASSAWFAPSKGTPGPPSPGVPEPPRSRCPSCGGVVFCGAWAPAAVPSSLWRAAS